MITTLTRDASARNMAYTPDDLRAIEQLIADNRAAKEEGERVAAECARQEAEAQRQRERLADDLADDRQYRKGLDDLHDRGSELHKG